MNALTDIDPQGSRPFVPSSPSNGIESIQENYTAKNPQDPLFGNPSSITRLKSFEILKVMCISIIIKWIRGMGIIIRLLDFYLKLVFNQCQPLEHGHKLPILLKISISPVNLLSIEIIIIMDNMK